VYSGTCLPDQAGDGNDYMMIYCDALTQTITYKKGCKEGCKGCAEPIHHRSGECVEFDRVPTKFQCLHSFPSARSGVVSVSVYQNKNCSAHPVMRSDDYPGCKGMEGEYTSTECMQAHSKVRVRLLCDSSCTLCLMNPVYPAEYCLQYPLLPQSSLKYNCH